MGRDLERHDLQRDDPVALDVVAALRADFSPERQKRLAVPFGVCRAGAEPRDYLAAPRSAWQVVGSVGAKPNCPLQRGLLVSLPLTSWAVRREMHRVPLAVRPLHVSQED